MANRPNILWIQTDEQRPDSLGCYGSAWAKTPHIDALASRGVVFRNAVCQSPVCVPSRASQFTGLYPQECSALHNDDCHHPFPAGVVTFNDVLRDAGYERANFGKWHAPTHDLWDVHDGPVNIGEYAGYFELNETYNEAAHHVIKRPGSTPIILAGTYPCDEDNPSKRCTNLAVDFMTARRDSDRPWLCRVSHNWPHTPVLPPRPWDTLYDPDELPIRRFDSQAYATRSAWDRRSADNQAMRALSEQQIRQIYKDYFGLCAYVDHEVGRLLAALDELGLADNTIILYQTDHGKNLGEWGAGEKGNFDREVWRVPFIWSAPQAHVPQGQVREDICEVLDTGRTMLALAGLADKTPEQFRGRNLFDASAAPEAVFGQINYQTMRVAMRTQRYRLDVTFSEQGRHVGRENYDGNLFDLQADPLERVNLYNDPAHAALRDNLLTQLESHQASLRPFERMGEIPE